MHRVERRTRSRWVVACTALAALAVLLGACSSDPSPTSTADPGRDASDAAGSSGTAGAGGAAASFPRTVEVGGKTVTVPAEPQRIAALSTDVAEVALALAGPERLAAVVDTVSDPAVGSAPEAAASIEHQLAMGARTTSDELASWGVDLVLISPNHASEEALSAELADGSIPIVVMPNSWDTLEDVQENIELIGRAVGADGEAERIVADIETRAAAVVARTAALDERPVVLILTNVARVPFLIGPGTTTADLVAKAGGTNAADVLGVTNTISGITAEQVRTADPDAILLVDGLGTGRAAFADLLDAPELAGVSAIATDEVLVLPVRDSFGTAQTLIDGLEAIAGWLHPVDG